jgi:hypothetical protein
MTLPVSAALAARLLEAANEGLDSIWLCEISWPAPVGTKRYATRGVTIGGNEFAEKMLGAPAVPKRTDVTALSFDALNDDVTVRLLNTPENADGGADLERLQDMKALAPVMGAIVKVGYCDKREIASADDIKWDGTYRVDKVQHNNREMSLYCTDVTLQPGEKEIGDPITDADWPVAPTSSYGQVRGPIIGKCETVPLVPVEVGLEATLAGEMDEQSKLIELETEDLSKWPDAGYVIIGDEIVRYPVIDRTNKILGSAGSPCLRGQGFPTTVAAAHSNGVLVRDFLSGKDTTLSGAITSGATTLNVASTAGFTSMAGVGIPRVLLIENEAISYVGYGSTTVEGLTRGVAVPTLAAVHKAGAIVRTIPVGVSGQPRYRYVAGAGVVSAVSNLRVQTPNGSLLPYDGGAASVSQVTTASGRQVTVVDVPKRARVDTFEGSSTEVPQEYILQNNGDGGGVALDPTLIDAAWSRWRKGPTMGSAFTNKLSWVIDPQTSEKAAILKNTATERIFDFIFNAHWDAVINNPRRRFGRFSDARIRIRYQYDRAPAQMPNDFAVIRIKKNGTQYWSFLMTLPLAGNVGGAGGITGQQVLPRERWASQETTKNVPLVSKDTGQVIPGDAGIRGEWIDPYTQPVGSGVNGAPVRHSNAYDGEARNFLSGYWNYGSQQPAAQPSSGSTLTGNLLLKSRQAPGNETSTDKVLRYVLTLSNPVGQPASFTTGFTGSIAGHDKNGNQRWGPVQFTKNSNSATQRITVNVPANRQTWADNQEVRVLIHQFVNSGGAKGATVGDVGVEVQYLPSIQGQDVDTTVDGSFFSVSGTGGNVPTAVVEQSVAIGAAARQWAREVAGRDPWDFFSQAAPEGSLGGIEFQVELPSWVGSLQMAFADATLELDYQPLVAEYDGLVVADMDGRVGTPVGGGAAEVLQDPTDVLAYLIDESEFLGMASYRDADSFEEVRASTIASGMRLARAVLEKIPLRQFMSQLCGESRLLMLADGEMIYARFATVEPTVAESTGTIGVQSDPARVLVRDDATIVSRIEDVANSIGYYYRRNLVTGDFRSVIEESHALSQLQVGVRRATIDLHWHQSARGYALGIEGQKAAVRTLTGFGIATAARIWDYVVVEVSAAVAEALQRYDALILHYPRMGYFNALGRVVGTQRLEGPVRWSVLLRMSASTNAYYWQAIDGSSLLPTFIKIADNGTVMEFWVEDVLKAKLDAGGLRIAGNFTEALVSHVALPGSSGDTGAPDNEAIRHDGTGAEIRLVRQRVTGTHAGKLERVLTIDANGVTLWAYDNGTTTVKRSAETMATMSGATGDSGIVDTATGLATGAVQVTLGNQVVMDIGDSQMSLRGDLMTEETL